MRVVWELGVLALSNLQNDKQKISNIHNFFFNYTNISCIILYAKLSRNSHFTCYSNYFLLDEPNFVSLPSQLISTRTNPILRSNLNYKKFKMSWYFHHIYFWLKLQKPLKYANTTNILCITLIFLQLLIFCYTLIPHSFWVPYYRH